MKCQSSRKVWTLLHHIAELSESLGPAQASEIPIWCGGQVLLHWPADGLGLSLPPPHLRLGLQVAFSMNSIWLFR